MDLLKRPSPCCYTAFCPGFSRTAGRARGILGFKGRAFLTLLFTGQNAKFVIFAASKPPSSQRALRDVYVPQKLAPHRLAAILDSQLPSPKLSLKMPPKLPLPHKSRLFFGERQSIPKGPCHIKNTTVILIHYGTGKKYDGSKIIRQRLWNTLFSWGKIHRRSPQIVN